MKKIVISILALALVLQSSLAMAADVLKVPTDLQASKNESSYFGEVSIDAGENIALKATVDMSEVRENFKAKLDDAIATITPDGGVPDPMLLPLIMESKVTGEFSISLTYPKTISLPNEIAKGSDMDGFNEEAKQIFVEESRKVVTDGDKSTLIINIKVAGLLPTDDTERPDFCTVEDLDANLEDWLVDMEFIGTDIKISDAGSYTFEGALKGSTTITSADNRSPEIAFEAVPKSGSAISVKVIATEEKDEPTKNPSRPGTGFRPGISGSGTSTTDPVVDTGITAKTFKDIAADDWYYDAIDYVTKKGLMTGTTATEFSPNLDTTRGMIATIIWRLEGSPAVSNAESYLDVNANDYYETAIAWGTQNNILKGYGDGNFGPMDIITREQTAAILERYANYKNVAGSYYAALSSFQDGETVSDWAQKNMEWAVGAGLITGKENGILDPINFTTRGEIATMLMRYCENILK